MVPIMNLIRANNGNIAEGSNKFGIRGRAWDFKSEDLGWHSGYSFSGNSFNFICSHFLFIWVMGIVIFAQITYLNGATISHHIISIKVPDKWEIFT